MRNKTILILKEHGMRCHLGPKLRPELVELNQKAGERVSRGGYLYRRDVWESMPESKNTNTKVRYEDRVNPDGKVQKWVRVFDFDEGVLRFEGFEETETVHQKIIDDGSITLHAQQQAEHFQNMSSHVLANCRQKNGLVSSGSGSLPSPSVRGPSGPPPHDANKSPASSVHSAQAQPMGPVPPTQVDGPGSTIDANGDGEADTEEEW